MKCNRRNSRKKQTSDEMLSMVQNSLYTSDFSIKERSNSVALPGFDKSLPCNLCKLKLNVANRVRVTTNGMPLADFLLFSQKQFDQDEGRPGVDIATEIKNGLNRYIDANDKLCFLKKTTSDEIYRHFKFDHSHQRNIKIKEKVTRILLNMLDTCVQSLCDKLDGKTFLNKNDTTIALHIIDTLIRISTKDNIQ